MSVVMLHGVLNMPPELWKDDYFDKMQRYQRYMQASRRIEDLEVALAEIVERFESRQNLHKDDCFAYQVASKALED